MQTKSVIQTKAQLPPLLLTSMTRLLLTQTSIVTRPNDPDNLAPEMLTFRATRVTAVLREMLDEKGYPHLGIND